MIQNMKYEMKKYVLTKNNLLFFVILSLFSIGILFWNEGSYINDKNTRQRFFEKIEKMNFSAADKQELKQERDRVKQEIYEDDLVTPKKDEMKKPGEYADTKLDDYCLLDEVLSCIDLVEKRNQNTAFLSDHDQGWNEKYQRENNQDLVDQKKLGLFVGNMSFGVTACFLVIFLLCSSFSMEYEVHVRPVLCVTKIGEDRIGLAKISCGVFLTLVANVFYSGLYCLCQFLFLGMRIQDWKQPLFYVDGCEICASGMTMQSYFIKQFLVSVIISILIALFTMLLSKRLRKGVLSLITVFIVFMIAFLPDLLNDVVYSSKYIIQMKDWYFISEPEFYRLLQTEKICNPVSLLRFQYYAEQPRYLQISNYQYPVEVFPVLTALVLIVILGAVILKRGDKSDSL